MGNKNQTKDQRAATPAPVSWADLPNEVTDAIFAAATLPHECYAVNKYIYGRYAPTPVAPPTAVKLDEHKLIRELPKIRARRLARIVAHYQIAANRCRVLADYLYQFRRYETIRIWFDIETRADVRWAIWLAAVSNDDRCFVNYYLAHHKLTREQIQATADMLMSELGVLQGATFYRNFRQEIQV